MECRKIWRNMVCTSFTIQPTVKMSTGSPKQDRASTNCAHDNYNMYLILCILRRSKERDENQKNISIFGRSSCYVGLFGAAIFLGIFGGGIFLAARYFRSTWPPTPGMACLCCVPRSGPIEGRLSFAGGFRVR